MSLEQAINENTATMRELIGVLSAKGGAAEDTAAAKRGPGRPRTTPAASTAAVVTLDMVKVAAHKLADEKGKPAAQELIRAHGSKSTTEMDPSKYAAFVAAVDVALKAAPDEDPGEAEDDTL